MPFGALYFNVNLGTCEYITKKCAAFLSQQHKKYIIQKKKKMYSKKYKEWLWHEAIPKLGLILILKGKFESSSDILDNSETPTFCEFFICPFPVSTQHCPHVKNK